MADKLDAVQGCVLLQYLAKFDSDVSRRPSTTVPASLHPSMPDCTRGWCAAQQCVHAHWGRKDNRIHRSPVTTLWEVAIMFKLFVPGRPSIGSGPGHLADKSE